MMKYVKYYCFAVFIGVLSHGTLVGENEKIPAKAHVSESFFSEVNQLIKDRKYDEALHKINETIHSTAPNPRIYRLRANLLFLTGYYEYALNDFERVADLRPHEVSSYVDIAILHYHLKQYEAAMGYIEHALSINPNSPFAFKVKMLISKDIEKSKKH